MNVALPWIGVAIAALPCALLFRPLETTGMGLASGALAVGVSQILLERALWAPWKRFGYALSYALLVQGGIFLALSGLVFTGAHLPLPLLAPYGIVVMTGTVGIGLAIPDRIRAD